MKISNHHERLSQITRRGLLAVPFARTFLKGWNRTATSKYLLGVARLGVLAACVGGLSPAYGNTTAHVDQPMAVAEFANVYWDSSWDADNPSLTRSIVDTNTKELIWSTYFSPLSEYGVNSIGWAGSFLPNAKCAQKAPGSVGFYDPVNTAIAGFIQCEHDNEPSIQGPNIIYNVILPQGSIESDFFTSNFCSGLGSPDGWHYHGLQNPSIIPFNLPFGGGPIYTIVSTNPKCSPTLAAFFQGLTHEMVEALTDPYPVDISIIPPHIQAETQNEIADICQSGQTPSVTSFTSPGLSQLFKPIQVSTYWSNAQQLCVPSSIVPTEITAAIKTSDGINFLTAVNGGGIGAKADPEGNWPLHTDATTAGAWEHFTLVFNANGTVSIKTPDGHFVTAIGGGGIGKRSDPQNILPLHTDASSVEPDGVFLLCPQSDGSVEIKMFNFGNPMQPRFVTAVGGGNIGSKTDPNNTLPLHTDAHNAGAWESFTIVPL